MNKGFLMLLKSAGFDPETLMREFQGVGEKFQNTIKHFDARLNSIDARLARIERHLGIENTAAIEHKETGS